MNRKNKVFEKPIISRKTNQNTSCQVVDRFLFSCFDNFMEYQIILSTVIALIAVMTGLGFIFNILLNPLKENQARLEAKLDELYPLKKNQARLEAKLDQLLEKSK